MIKRFEKTEGRYIEKIYGQERLAYSHSDDTDFYDLIAWAERGGYQGDYLTFHDLTNGKVYRPFEKKRDVVYSDPVYADRYYYFLQGDYRAGMITLYRYLPEEAAEAVTGFGFDEVKLYNLKIMGNPLYVTSQDNETFECYYPERFSIELGARQTVSLIEDGKVYIEEWVEEGWDEENSCATDDYRFYNRVIVKDFSGNTVSEEKGFLFIAPNGDCWIA